MALGSSSKIKKDKKSKSFRGLVTGKSKKDKKKAGDETEEVAAKPIDEEPMPPRPSTAKPEEEKEKPVATKPVDDETVYGADFDEQSKATATVEGSESKPDKAPMPALVGDSIAIVLLLMDPVTRRFELLQLDFDTTSATVADILQQIPISATEESLRTQSFDCVCDTDGNEYDHEKSLSDYVDGNAVVITVPKTNTKGPLHAAKMAKPILRDPKVIEMLRSAGVPVPSAPAQDETVKKAVPAPPSAPRAVVVPPVAEENSAKESTPTTDGAKSSSLSSLIIMGVVAAYMARVVVNFQTQITTPLSQGSTLVPGAWRSRCGFVQTNNCKPAYIEMGTDGTLQIVENEGVTFSLVGKVCDEDVESCVPGVVISEDGTLTIGGATAKMVVKSKTSLNPWPFVEGIGPAKGRKAWF